MVTEDTTFGVEVEFYRLPNVAADGWRKWLRFACHDDGSLRDKTYVAGDLAVFPQEDERGLPILSAGMQLVKKNIGLEVVTEPYAYGELLGKMRKLSYYCASIPQSPRSSIHVHVDADGMTFEYIKNLLLWVHALEAPIFRISCGGGIHRGAREYQGAYNDHRYARPLSAPIGVSWGGIDLADLIIWQDIVSAATASELMAAWGRLDAFWRQGFEHYWPHRLHMINISSILRQGTIEWRIFDGLYSYMDTIVEFVYRMHKLAERGAPDFEFVLGSKPGIDAQWFSILLDMDISQLWGDNWQTGCKTPALRSHYQNAPELPRRNRLPIMPISNGVVRDTGKPGFVIFNRNRG